MKSYSSHIRRILSTLTLIAVIGLAARQNAVAKPPEGRSLLQRLESSFLFNSMSRWVVREYSKGLLDEQKYNFVSDQGRENIVSESHIGVVGVVLYEFATGDGPSTRYFDSTSPLTRQIIESPGVYWVLNQYATQGDYQYGSYFDTSFNLLNCRYQFSPLVVPMRPGTWEFSIQQHIRTLESQNLSQILLGSFNADVIAPDSGHLYIHIWNKTSKKSLFGGMARRLQRPLLLGTVSQHIVFELTPDEVKNILLNKVYK